MPPPALPPLLRRAGPRRIDWGERSERTAGGCSGSLLRRVYLFEVLACACGGTRRVISSNEEGPAARKIPTHLGLPADEPRPAPARLDQGELFSTGPPDDLRQLAPPDGELLRAGSRWLPGDQRVVFDIA